MAYLPEFKNDLFISYRRAINEGPDRWVSSFQKALHLSLKQLVGDKVVIWRDEEQLHTGDNWRDKLVEALESAAIYLAIISRTYLESRECRNELDLMLAMLRADLGKRQHRIFPVYVHPPRFEADVPAELQGTHHREFFERSDDAPLGFSELDAGPECLEFQQRLARLAQEVTLALERLRDDSLTRFVGRVFVADVEPGLYRDRDNLCADLFDRRYLVAPDREYLWSSANIENDIRADLQEAQLAIHLVTPTGVRTEAEVHQARWQLNLAVEVLQRCGRRPPMVWISTREGASAALQRLLSEIDGPLADKGIEVLVGDLETMKALVYKRLSPSPSPSPPATTTPAPVVDGDDVVVLVEDGEYDAFGAMRKRLIEEFDVEPVPVRLSGGTAPDDAALAQALTAGSRCLIYWGAQPEAWLQQLLHLPQLAGHLGRERLAILATAPAGKEQQQFVTRKARVICAGDSADRELHEFFSRQLTPER